MPDFEFWFAGYALISAAGFLFALVLGAIGAGPMLTKLQHRRIIWSGVAVMAALTWWQLAKKEQENTKPERDYAYLIPSTYVDHDLITLATVSTGTMRNVRMAVRRIGSNGEPEPYYIYSNGINGVTVDEGINLSLVMLPIGSYAIDIDPPTKLGKVDERIQIEKINDPHAFTTKVIRKLNREILIPPPEKISSTSIALLLLCVFSPFLIFSSVLAWGSWRAP